MRSLKTLRSNSRSALIVSPLSRVKKSAQRFPISPPYSSFPAHHHSRSHLPPSSDTLSPPSPRNLSIIQEDLRGSDREVLSIITMVSCHRARRSSPPKDSEVEGEHRTKRWRSCGARHLVLAGFKFRFKSRTKSWTAFCIAMQIPKLTDFKKSDER